MTIDDLRKLDKNVLAKSFGNFGKTIWNMSRGIDERNH